KIGIDQFCRSIALFKEHLLPLPYHPKKSVVQDHDLHCRFGLKNSAQFLDGHLISAITDNSHYFLIGASHFCSKGGRKGKSHGSQPARGNIASGGIEFCVTAGDHLVLPNIGNYNGVAFKTSVDLIYYLGHFELSCGSIEVMPDNLF